MKDRIIKASATSQRTRFVVRRHYFSFLIMVLSSMILSMARGDESTVRYQITGLFCPEREADLQATFEKINEVKLLAVDYKSAVATLQYDPAAAFSGAKPEQVLERLDNLIRSASQQTFGVRALRTIPNDKLTLIEIPIVGLDCKACAWAAYGAVYKLEGVEQATASFKEGKVTALVDAAKTDRAKLEAALKQRGVTLPADVVK
jgi:copper chaperone CopZ